MKAAVIQLRGDRGLAGNLACAGHWVACAAGAGATLVVLPENFGYFGQKDLFEAGGAEATPDGPARRFLSDIARSHRVWLLGGTIPIADEPGAKPYAASLLVSPDGRQVARYNKIHLFDVHVEATGRQYRESDDYRHGEDVITVEVPPVTLGLSVCYDLRFPELYRRQAELGATVLAAPSAFTAATGEAHWQLLLRARAVENLCFVLGANMANRADPKNPTWGGSAIIDPWGRVIAGLEDEEGFATAELDLDGQARMRSKMPALEHRRLPADP
ncbi:MAG: carbon-nitrogen hydrolase [Porticoccaceae bacterium]|nr:carbon-nitrogen hydrolase [Porticoccaceae bacterium]